MIIETDVHGPEQYERCKAASPDAIAAGGGRFVARGGKLAVLEGDWHPSRLVVLELEDLETVSANSVVECRRSAVLPTSAEESIAARVAAK